MFVGRQSSFIQCGWGSSFFSGLLGENVLSSGITNIYSIIKWCMLKYLREQSLRGMFLWGVCSKEH